MADLISTALRAEVVAALNDIQDTFAKSTPVIFYKVTAKEVIMFDPNYNANFMDNIPNSSVTETTQSQSFTCRINYLARQDYDTFLPGGEDTGTKSKFYYNRIKLRMKEDAFEYLQDAERFEILGEKYQIEESWRRIGLLDTFLNYQIILRRVN